jgi:NAD(P)-dependent dehydrogenase (short-subunit alcohol dehydrogenase family)
MSGVFARLSPAAWHDCSHQAARAAIGAKPLEYPASMQGKTCVITGATSGIGRAAAEALAAMGARVVMIARDKQRGEAMLTQLRDRFPLVGHRIHYADLLRLAEVERAAADIAAAEPRVDVLLNNAGAMFASRKITPDGFERTFALNHVAPFVLTHGLRERLFAAAPARVINTAGALHHLATLHLEDLRLEHRYNAFYAYAHAKLCCVLFTRELARRWASRQVTANCLHPGEVATRFGYQSGGLIPYAFAVIHLFGSSPERGARRIVRLASAREYSGITGRYFYKAKLARPNPLAEDDENAERLWQATARLVGIQ